MQEVKVVTAGAVPAAAAAVMAVAPAAAVAAAAVAAAATAAEAAAVAGVLHHARPSHHRVGCTSYPSAHRVSHPTHTQQPRLIFTRATQRKHHDELPVEGMAELVVTVA